MSRQRNKLAPSKNNNKRNATESPEKLKESPKKTTATLTAVKSPLVILGNLKKTIT